MTGFRIAGLDATGLAVSADGASVSVSETLTSRVTPPPTAPAAFIGKKGTGTWAGLGIAAHGSHGGNWTRAIAPRVYGAHYRLTGASGNRIESADFNDSNITPARLIGGTARIYRISNGEMSLIRESEIVGGNWGRWNRLTSADDKGATSGFEFRFDGFSRDGGTYYFGVGAVDGAAQMGEIGWTSYTPSGLGGDAASNSEADLAGDYTPGGALAAPANVTATADASGDGLVVITWDAVGGASGYVPFISYNIAGDSIPANRYLDLEDDGGAALQAGDLLIVSAAAALPTMDMVSQRAWTAGSILNQIDGVFSASTMAQKASWFSYEYKAFDGGVPNPDDGICGNDYVEIEIDSGQPLTNLIERQWHSNALDSHYATLDPEKTYVFEVWVWASRAATAAFQFAFDNASRIGLGPETEDLEAGWQELTFSKSPTGALSAAQTAVGYWQINVTTASAAALTLRLAGIRIYESGEVFEGAGDVDHWPSGAVVRSDVTVKARPLAPTMDQLTGPPGQSCITYTVAGQIAAIHAAGAQPHIQLEWYHSDAEFQDFIAFIAAPVSSGHPMALRRAALGRTDPWTDQWDEFVFELSNEAWNTVAEFWTSPYNLVDAVTAETYTHGEGFGIIFRRIALAMMASPYWTDKIKFVIGSQPNQAFGAEAASKFLLPVEVGPSHYMGGWDAGSALAQENGFSYQSVLASAPLTIAPAAEDNRSRLETMAAASGGVFTVGVNVQPMSYESGPGYQQDGLNGAVVRDAQAVQQEVVMKSRACATGTIDAFAVQARTGARRSVFFTMGSGDRWTARAPDSDGGHSYIPWQIVREWHERVGAGIAWTHRDINIAAIEVEDPAEEMQEIDSIFVYAMTSVTYPGRVVLAVGNRSLSTTYKPTICTPFVSAAGCKVVANVGDYRQHNRYAPGKRLATPITVDGGGQSGTSLAIAGLAKLPTVDDTFTIEGVSGTYTVNSVTSWGQTTGTVGLSTALDSSPADGADVTWGDVTDGFHDDDLCVAITLSEDVVSVPANLSRIVVDDALGVGESGIAPGNCVLIQLDGVS